MIAPRFYLFSLIVLTVVLPSSEGHTQSSDHYAKKEATSGRIAQLNIHASATKDCKPAPLPNVRLIDRPANGTLIVRRGLLTTNRIPACPNLKIPAQVVLYTSVGNFVGKDRAVYEVESANGDKQKFDIEIDVKAAPPSIKSKDTDRI
jgi:hypothetical protein